MSYDGITKHSGEDSDQAELKQIIRERLQAVQTEIAADYKIPEQLWAQMVNALVRGAPASGGAFSKEELMEFNDATKARLGDYLAEATRGMVPGNAGLMSDSQGVTLGRVDSKGQANQKAREERNM